MANFILVKDNTEKREPENPKIFYEVVIDMGTNGTKTILATDSVAECYVALDKLKVGEISKEVDITKAELEATKGISITLSISTAQLDVFAHDINVFSANGEVIASTELVSYKVVEDKVVTGLCPRSWENTDISTLSRVQINGILDNCEKCQRYSQCQKVAELNDKLVELDEAGE